MIAQWREQDHPRVPGGSPEGGEWTDNPGHVASWATRLAAKMTATDDDLDLPGGLLRHIEKIDDPSIYNGVDIVQPDGSHRLVESSESARLRQWFDKHLGGRDEKTGITAVVTNVGGAYGRSRRPSPYGEYIDATGVRYEESTSNGVMVSVEFRNDADKKVGKANRVFHLHGGVPTVEHTSAAIDEDFQGQGMFSRFNHRAEQLYRRQGFRQVRLHADSTVGGYAWAKAGYDWDGTVSRDEMYKRLRKILANPRPPKLIAKHASGPVRAQAQALLDRAAAGDHPTPLELAMLGWSDGAVTWFGKELLLRQGKWDGVRQLD